MISEVVRWTLVIWILVCKGCEACTWKQKTIRVLAVFDDYDEDINKELDSAMADRNYEGVNDEKYCVPRILHSTLHLNGTVNEMDVIRRIQTPFKRHEYCVVIFASRKRSGRYVLEYAASKDVPVVNILTQDVNQTIVPVEGWKNLQWLHLNDKSSLRDQVASIAPTLKSLGWKKMAMIYDNSVHSLQIAGSVVQTFSSNRLVMMNSTHVSQETDLNTLAARLDSLRIDCSSFLILTDNPVIANAIFRAADWLGLLGQANMWLLFSNMERDRLVTDILPYELFMVHPYHQRWTPRELVHDAVTLIVSGLRVMGKAEKDNNDLCSCRCECTSFKQSLYRSMIQSEFTGRTGLVKFDDKGERRYGQYDISVIALSNDQLMTQNIGAWDGTSVQISSPVSRPKLRVLINEYPPNIMSVDKQKNAPCPSGASVCTRTVPAADGTKQYISRCCYGFAIDVLHLLKGAMGFEPELHFSEDGQFGVYDEKNKTWNGIVSELLQGKGDITLDLYISARRATVLQFTEPYAPSGIRLLVKERSGKGTNIYWLSYLRPFTNSVWLSLLGSMGIMIVFLWIVEKFAPCRHQRENCEKPDIQQDQTPEQSAFDLEQRGYSTNKYETEEEQLQEVEPGEDAEEAQQQRPSYVAFGLDNAVCFTLALAFGRPADEAKPMLHGARLASVAFGVAMMMLISSYSANLAAFLIVEDKYTPVESIYDDKMANPPSGFKYGTIKGSYMADFFSNADSPYMRNMWYHMQKHNVESSSEGVKKVKSGELDVFISDHISLVYESLNDLDCELKVVGEPFAMSGASLAVKKGSPWFATINDVLQQLKSKDLTDFIQKFWVQKYKCSNEKPPSQLQIQDLSGLFLQLLIAFVACFLGTSIHNAVGALAHKYKKRSSSDVSSTRYSVDDLGNKQAMSVVKCKFTRMTSKEAEL